MMRDGSFNMTIPVINYIMCRGTVSTSNSGGFASVRCRNFDPALDLGAYQGIELRIKVRRISLCWEDLACACIRGAVLRAPSEVHPGPWNSKARAGAGTVDDSPP